MMLLMLLMMIAIYPAAGAKDYDHEWIIMMMIFYDS